jgi:hypothetical protein
LPVSVVVAKRLNGNGSPDVAVGAGVAVGVGVAEGVGSGVLEGVAVGGIYFTYLICLFF